MFSLKKFTVDDYHRFICYYEKGPQFTQEIHLNSNYVESITTEAFKDKTYSVLRMVGGKTYLIDLEPDTVVECLR